MSTPDLQLSKPSQPLLPGQPVRLELTVRNTGPEVERFDLEPSGPLTAWVTLSEPEVRIWPGEAATVSVTTSLPSGPHPLAGATVIGVLVHAADGSTASVDVAAEVAPRPAVAVEAPVPHAIRSARWARVHVTVGNPGNTPLTVGVAAQDREGRLEHTLRGRRRSWSCSRAWPPWCRWCCGAPG